MKSDVTPSSPDSSVSFDIAPKVTQGDDYVVDEDAHDDEDQRQVMCDVQNSIKVGRD